jgi:hypothetical protein
MGTFWENHRPGEVRPGTRSGREFVGWTGLSVISMVLEYLFGLQRNDRPDELTWTIRTPKNFGVERYPVEADGQASFHRTQDHLRLESSIPLKVLVKAENLTRQVQLQPGIPVSVRLDNKKFGR